MLRSKRVRPGLDDKVLADWNGLMIAALANAGTMLGEPSWIEMAARAFDFIVRSMTKATGRIMKDSFLARRPAALSGARLRLRQHDPRGAGAVRGDRAGRLSTGRWPGSGRSTPTTPIRATAAISSPRPTPRPGGAPGLDQRRRHAQSEFHCRAKSRPAGGADRRRSGASRPTGCSTACWPARPTACCSTPSCSTRSICGCTRPRSCSPDQSIFASPPRGKLPYLNRVILRAPTPAVLPANHPAQAKIQAALRRGRGARRSSASARPARCR